jgi:hypothetical protein
MIYEKKGLHGKWELSKAWIVTCTLDFWYLFIFLFSLSYALLIYGKKGFGTAKGLNCRVYCLKTWSNWTVDIKLDDIWGSRTLSTYNFFFYGYSCLFSFYRKDGDLSLQISLIWITNCVIIKLHITIINWKRKTNKITVTTISMDIAVCTF